MAANLIPFQPHSATIIHASSSGHHKSDSQRKNWWTPLFGWSSEPDYINNTHRTKDPTFPARSSETDMERRPVTGRKSAVKFTEEKARKLRMLTVETQTFHDAMYHSAIASRFASDFSDRFDA